MKVLGKLIGDWTWKSTNTRGGKTTHTAGTMTAEWILNGRFVQCRAVRTPGKHENIQILGFDPVGKQYRLWCFDSSGNFEGPMAGQWDAETKTLTWRLDGQDDTALVMADHFIESDTIESTLTVSRQDGTVLHEQHGLSVRIDSVHGERDSDDLPPTLGPS
jgi:hypothetical protein